MVDEMKKIAFALLFVLFGTSALASDNSVSIRVIAFEDSSCGAWINSAGASGQRQIYLFWFRGFASGHNAASPNAQIKNMPNNNTVALYIDKFCRENPLLPFTSAASNLIRDLQTK
jgi:hypothetical protein